MTSPPLRPLLAHSEDDRRDLWLALGVAVTLHVAVLLFVALPEPRGPIFSQNQPAPTDLTRYKIPPPPPPERPRRPERLPTERMIPVPDPDPDRPEPIRERVRDEIRPTPQADLPPILGEPVAPPPAEPFDLTYAEIVPPELIADSKVEPVFPELARVVRHSGRVILRAVINEEGAVAEIEVVDCSPPGFGFEESATEAVRQWVYRPATLSGRPVPVYLVVLVEFKLH